MSIGASLGNFSDTLFNTFISDKPNIKVQQAEKDPKLGKYVGRKGGMLDQFGEARTAGAENTQKYIDLFNEQKPEITAGANQEIANLDRYFMDENDSRGIGGRLAKLRADQGALELDARDRAFEFAAGGLNKARLFSGNLGDSSYNRAQEGALTNDIALKSAIQRAAQERSDVNFLEQARLGLTGQRQNRLMDVVGLENVQSDALRANLAKDSSLFQPLFKMQQDNTFYTPYRKRGTLEKVRDVTSATLQLVGDIAAAYASGGMSELMGGMGGGGSQKGSGSANSDTLGKGLGMQQSSSSTGFGQTYGYNPYGFNPQAGSGGSGWGGGTSGWYGGYGGGGSGTTNSAPFYSQGGAGNAGGSMMDSYYGNFGI